MNVHDSIRVRAAARHAKLVFPGAIGQMLSTELTSWANIGWYLGSDSLVMSVVDQVLQMEVNQSAQPSSVKPS